MRYFPVLLLYYCLYQFLRNEKCPLIEMIGYRLKKIQGADKEKQKSEAKHIHMRKRKALADLFKHLSLIGVWLIRI